MDLAGKKVFVTGAGGFIGGHLCERLVKEGAKVKALLKYNSGHYKGCLNEVPKDVLNEMELVWGDVSDGSFMEKEIKGSHVVFHLAALIGIPYSYVAPESYVNTNVKGTLNVLNACLKHQVPRLVQTSTSEVYGSAQYVPMDLKHPLVGQSPYSATKIAADKLAESYFLSFGLPVGILRPFNTFGPRQSLRAVLPTICTQALAKKKEIKLGSLSPIRDFNYVSNTVDAFLQMATIEKAIGQTLHVGSGKGISIADAAKLIFELVGHAPKIISDEGRVRPENSEVEELVCDYSLAKEVLGYSPKVSFKEGIEKVLEYYSQKKELLGQDHYHV